MQVSGPSYINEIPYLYYEIQILTQEVEQYVLSYSTLGAERQGAGSRARDQQPEGFLLYW